MIPTIWPSSKGKTMETEKGPVVAKGFIFSKEAKGMIFMKNEVEKKKH